jgi:clan AA aspartic protease
MTLWNNTDLDLVDRGLLQPIDVRVEHLEALVDTGATTLVIPIDVCRRLGLRRVRTVPVRLADGTDREIDYMGSIFLRILDREMTCDALAAPEGTTPLIGQIPLEALDLVVDPRSRELRPNPAHPNGPLLYALCAA